VNRWPKVIAFVRRCVPGYVGRGVEAPDRRGHGATGVVRGANCRIDMQLSLGTRNGNKSKTPFRRSQEVDPGQGVFDYLGVIPFVPRLGSKKLSTSPRT
jgi:hypothetical protein